MEQIQKIPRWYLLRLSDQFSKEVSLSLFGGLSSSEKSFFSFKEEVKKSLKLDYERILLPWNFVFHSDIKKIISFIKETPSHWVVSVHSLSLKFKKDIIDSLTSESDLLVDFFLENYDSKTFSYLESVRSQFQITIPAYKDLDVQSLIDSLPIKYHEKLHIHFPYYHKKHSQLYTSVNMYNLLKEKYYPPPQIDIFNLSIPEDLKLEPELTPVFSYPIPHSDIHISVIIPSYNSKESLLLVLKHLYKQDLPKKNWEVIVVDDGSSDKTENLLKKQTYLSNMNFKYLYFPRLRERYGIGDHRFRAGLSRNVGVKNSEGQYLAFLDSDILIPRNYLSSICEKLSRYDVIQHPRYHLKRRSPKEYEDIDKKSHTFIKGNTYWEDFYKSDEDWNEKDKAWKYISTNTLCLKKEIFKKAGWFRKNYTCYGFEDTDLGWRLSKMKCKFHFNKVNTYHLYRSSEFLNFHFIKSYLLGQSAGIFFRNTHSLEGYEEFKHLINNK